MTIKPSVYICSTSGFCGKSVISLGLALNLKDAGYNVGYFKPIGWEMSRGTQGERIDDDAALMSSILDLGVTLDLVVPVIFDFRYIEEADRNNSFSPEDKILKAYEKMSEEKDIMIVEGPSSLGIGSSMKIDPINLSRKIKSKILIVSRFQNDTTIDRTIWENEAIRALGGNLMGFVLNRVPRTEVERAKRFVPKEFSRFGIELLGIVTENIEIMAPTVREICENMNCEVLTCNDQLDNLVEDIVIGAMSAESSLSYFRRSFRKAVITGGDRTDVQFAALETDLSALILTGNLYPDARVLARAEELKVPVILTSGSTFSTVKHISSLTGRINAKNKKKVDLAKKIVKEYVDWKKIIEISISK